MKISKKSKASLLVSLLAIFVLVSSILLIIYTYSNNNLKQAKNQEENIHAYFLAYSGCEMAYIALDKEEDDFAPSDVNKKWEEFAAQFAPSNVSFLNAHKICISVDGSVSETGYNSIPLLSAHGHSLTEADMPELENAVILVKIDKVPDDASGEESQFKGFLRVESIAKTGMGTAITGYAKNYLYIDTKNKAKIYWR